MICITLKIRTHRKPFSFLEEEDVEMAESAADEQPPKSTEKSDDDDDDDDSRGPGCVARCVAPTVAPMTKPAQAANITVIIIFIIETDFLGTR